jgi:hypothetical protein
MYAPVRAAVCVVGLMVALTCTCASAAKADSGIAGRVLIGPTCPVERPGESCEQPYAVKIDVLGAARHRLVRTFRSGADGRFRITLASGRYTLKAARPGLPSLAPRNVTVRRAAFTKVKLVFDTGIR